MESSQTFMKSTNKRLTQLKTPSRKRLKVEFAIKPEIDQESTVIKLAQQDNNDHVSQDHISNNLTEELANIPLLSPNKSQTVDVGGYLFNIEVVNLLQDRQGVNIMDQSWTLRDVASSLCGHDNHINIDELVFRDETGCEFQLETLACSLSQNMSYYLLDTKTVDSESK